MSHENSDEMPGEIDFSGAVRGKYLASYQRWTSVTSAEGALHVSGVTSKGDESGPSIVLIVRDAFHISPRSESVRRIAPEVRTAASHAG